MSHKHLNEDEKNDDFLLRNSNSSLRILRLPRVKDRSGLSRSSIYVQISLGLFPRPISLGGRAVGWLESDIDNWIQAKVEAARQR